MFPVSSGFNPLPCASKGETLIPDGSVKDVMSFNPLPCASKGETANCRQPADHAGGFNPLPCASKGETLLRIISRIFCSLFQSAPLREQGRNVNATCENLYVSCFNPLPCASKGETLLFIRRVRALIVSIRSPARAREKQQLICLLLGGPEFQSAPLREQGRNPDAKGPSPC